MKLKRFLKFSISCALSATVLLSTVACDGLIETPQGNGEAQVWTAGGTKKFLRDLDYSEYHDSKSITISAFRNENESAQILITPAEDTNYTIELSDLTSTDGKNKLAKESFTVYHERYIEVKNTYDQMALTGTGWYPDALVPYEAIVRCGENQIKANQNQGIWVTVKPDKEQVAGTYTGAFTVRTVGKSYSVPVTVNVLEYTLSDKTHIKNSFGITWEEIVYGELDSSVEIQEAYYDFFLDYRVSPQNFPGNEHHIFSLGSDLDEWLDYLVKYATDDRMATYCLPHNYLSCVYDVPDLDAAGNLQYDGEGNILKTKRSIASTNMSHLMGVVEKIWDKGVQINVDLFEKATHDAFYYDEFTLMKDGDYRVNVNMTLMYRMFQHVGYKKTIEQSKTNGAYALLSAEEKGIIDQVSERLNKVNYTYEKTLAESTDESDIALYDERYGGTITAFYNLLVARGKKDAEGIEKVFQVLTDEEQAVMEKLIREMDETKQTMLDSLINIPLHAIGYKDEEKVVARTTLISLITAYGEEAARDSLHAWSDKWYGEEGEVWWYTCVNPKAPYPTYHIEDELLSSRLLSWMMYDYGITGNLLWDSSLYNIAGTTNTIPDYYQTANRFTTSNGDGFVVYPGRQYDIKGPVGSIRLQSIRDGSEEYELFYALEEFYKTRAEEKGLSYEGAALDNIIELMAKSMYDGVMCTYYDGYLDNFANNREVLNNLLLLAANTGTVIESFEIEKGIAKITFSSANGNTVKIDGQTQSGNNDGTFTTYTREIPLAKEENRFNLSVIDKEGTAYSLSLSLGGKSTHYQLAGGEGVKQDEITVKNGTVSQSSQEGKSVWTFVADKTAESLARIEFNVSKFHITKKVNTVSVDVYAQKDSTITVLAKVANGSYIKVKDFELTKGWNTLRLDASLFGMTDTLGVEIFAFRGADNEFGAWSFGSMIVEEKR